MKETTTKPDIDRTLPATRITDGEKRAVVTYLVAAAGGPVSRASIVGLPVRENADYIVIRMYGAGCLYGESLVSKSEILETHITFP